MKFNDLVNYILNEAGGVDPWKYAYKGSPVGFRKDTGIGNPEKFVPTNTGPGDKGKYIEQDAFRILRAALLVTASDPEAGTELKRVLQEFGEAYFSYSNNLQEVKSLEDRISKLPNQDSDLAMELKGRLKEYITLTQNAKLKVEEMTPDVFDAVQDLVKEGGQNFVKALKSSKEKEFNSLEELESGVESEDEKRTISFLNDIWRGKSKFEPFTKFVEVEERADRNPIPRLLTMYKSVINLMVKNNLVGSPERTFNFITGQTSKTRTIAEPTKGRTVMKQKDPALVNVINAIKKRKYEEAKQAVNNTKLDNAAKTNLMINIDKLSKGGMSEADVIRPLYQQ